MRILVAAIAICLLVSCKKYNSHSECIDSKVEIFKQREVLCSDATVNEYLFEGKVVWVFDQGSCIADGGADVYDSNCNYLGTLGGVAGNRKIGGVDFFSGSRYRTTVWSNH